MCRSKKPTLNMNPRGAWPRPPWLLPCSQGLWEAACPGVLRADGQRVFASLKHLLCRHPSHSHPPHLVLRPSLHWQHLRCPFPSSHLSFPVFCGCQLPLGRARFAAALPQAHLPAGQEKQVGLCAPLACAWCFCERSLRLHSFWLNSSYTVKARGGGVGGG